MVFFLFGRSKKKRTALDPSYGSDFANYPPQPQAQPPIQPEASRPQLLLPAPPPASHPRPQESNQARPNNGYSNGHPVYGAGNGRASQSQPHLMSSQQQRQHCRPVIVNQHYYLNAPSHPPPPYQPQEQPYPPQQQNHPYPLNHANPTAHTHGALGRLTGSMMNLAQDVVPAQLVDESLTAWRQCSQTYDQVYHRLNDLMTLIDGEELSGSEGDLFRVGGGPLPPAAPAAASAHHDNAGAVVLSKSAPSSKPKSKSSSKNSSKSKNKNKNKHAKSSQPAELAVDIVGGSYFSKVELYANSRLPKGLPPVVLHIPTWPLLCLAAQYSQRVYDRPGCSERDDHVSSDWRTGTKAMRIKSVSMDHMNTIVFAIRGSATFMDWAVNLNTSPASPRGLLDDPGNLCHAGFLSVARKMVRPVAARLRALLADDPARSAYSLLITGHSAGGAVAALLYAHMLAQSPETRSELNILTASFRRVHCVTFGAPPVSLLPLEKPAGRPDLRKSLFFSIVNEGDPVVRADKAYVRSLLELLALPAPIVILPPAKEKDKSSSSSSSHGKSKDRRPSPLRPKWNVPPCTLSNAGRLIVLRTGDAKMHHRGHRTVRERLNEGVTAVTCHEAQLRGLIWGDPACHLMNLYAGRIEMLAVSSVTCKGRKESRRRGD